MSKMSHSNHHYTRLDEHHSSFTFYKFDEGKNVVFIVFVFNHQVNARHFRTKRRTTQLRLRGDVAPAAGGRDSHGRCHDSARVPEGRRPGRVLRDVQIHHLQGGVARDCGVNGERESARSATGVSQWRAEGQHHWQTLRVRGEMIGPGTYENVGDSQPVLIVIHPMISPPHP
jgi:hypothetical protein